MPVRATVYVKAGITSVPIGHPGVPSVIWGNPKGIWHGWMRSWEWAESGRLLVASRPQLPRASSPCATFICLFEGPGKEFLMAAGISYLQIWNTEEFLLPVTGPRTGKRIVREGLLWEAACPVHALYSQVTRVAQWSLWNSFSPPCIPGFFLDTDIALQAQIGIMRLKLWGCCRSRQPQP